MNPKTTLKTLTLKGISLFLYINTINLIVVLCALYFSAIFIFNTENKVQIILQDYQFHFLIWASLLSIAAGYIIHYFYEEELQTLKQPFRTYFKRFLSRKEYLSLYIALNTISLILGSIISIRALFFFVIYQFLIWLYSHKLSHILGVNILSKSILTLLPFLALAWHFKHLSETIILFGILLFILILLKELYKNIQTTQSDSIYQKPTIPNSFGIHKTRILMVFLLILAILLNILLPFYYHLAIMEYYLKASTIVYFLLIVLLFIPPEKKYTLSLILLKIWIVFGIFSIPFIDWNFF